MTLSPEAAALLLAEEGILKTVVESLTEQRGSDQRRLAVEADRARELTSELVAARRDEDKAMLASDEAVSHALKDKKVDEIATLERLIRKPYFGRIVLEEEVNGAPRQIEYKIGFAANTDCRIIDWRRAPLSKLYYEYREGDEYSEEIQGRERTGSVLLRNTVDIHESKLTRVTCRLGTFSRGDDGWMPAGGPGSGSHTAGHLPAILSLITPEQFKTITEDATTVILIQGIAGSGKTTVALHRLAWLLHEDNSALQPAECAVIIRSNTLRSYLSGLLPSIDVEGVSIMTFAEWLTPTLRRAAAFALTDDGVLRRPAERAAKSIERLLRSMALLKTIDGRLRSEPRVASASLAPDQCVRDVLAALDRPEEIVKNDDSKLISRELVVEAKRLVARNLADGVADPALSSALARVFQLRTGGLLRADGTHGRYGHLVVDELQDYGSLELACLIDGVRSTRDLTLVGDTAQQLDLGSGFPGWDRLRQHWAFAETASKYIALTISHRSTLPIMRLAEHIHGTQSVTHGRPGRVPIWFRCSTEELGIKSVIEWLGRAVERYPTALTAVICHNPSEAKQALSLLKPSFGQLIRLGDEDTFSFEEGIVVTDVREAKGLEFPNVLIWNPTSRVWLKSDETRNMLYVAVSRAEENLCLVTWQRPAEVLPSFSSPLVRGIEVKPEEEEAEET